MNIKELEKTISQLKRTDDEITKIGKQIEAVMHNKVTSIELTFTVKKHEEKRAFVDNEGDLRFIDPTQSHRIPRAFFDLGSHSIFSGVDKANDGDLVKLSVSDTAFLEIMGIFLEPLKSTRNVLVIKLKEHGIKFEQ